MGFFDKFFETEHKYKLKGWRGKEYSLTAEELYNRVLADSQSDYNWIASATELVKVCNEPYFPEIYANGIKLIILNCFANLELKKEYPTNKERTDNDAVYSCYHSLPSKDETVIKVKEKYLTAIIEGIIRYSKDEVRFPIHMGPAYRKVCDDWKKAKLEEYSSKVKIDFEKLREDLYDDFEMTIRKAEKNGIFAEEDKENNMKVSKFLSSIKLKDVDYYA